MVPLQDYMRLALKRLSDGHENLGMIPSQHLLWVLGFGGRFKLGAVEFG